MNKSFVSLSLVFFGICMVISSVFISNALRDIAFNQHLAAADVNVEQTDRQWEVVVVDQSHILLFNHYTGEYFTRFITDEEWSAEWKQFSTPN